MSDLDGRVDFEVVQGEDFSAQLVWSSDSDTPQNVIEPIKMDIIGQGGGVLKSLELTDQSPDLPEGQIPEISYSSSQGLIQLHLEDSVTASMPAGAYDYDLFVTADDGGVYAGDQRIRLCWGKVFVLKRYTII